MMKNNRIKLLPLCLMLIPLLISMGAMSFAWMVLASSKTADVEGIDIDKPPVIGIVNNETTTEDILNLEGLDIGSPKCIVFCVTPSNENVKQFILKLAYTTNLGASIDLYPCVYSGTAIPTGQGVGINAEQTEDLATPRAPETGDYVVCPAKDGSDTVYYYSLTGNAFTPSSTSVGDGYTAAENAVVDGENPENLALYKTYRDNTALEDNFMFTDDPWSEDWDNNRGRYVFYALYVHWENGSTQTIDKEVDAVYVSARGIIDLGI